MLIIVSFIFAGFFASRMGSNAQSSIATVGTQEITSREFQNKFNEIINMYSRFMGGKPLTNKQIKNFKLKKLAINALIDERKKMVIANNLNLAAASNEVKEQIKKQTFFHVNNKFDVATYRSKLTRAGFSPKKYEELIARSLLVNQINALEYKNKTFPSLEENLAEIVNQGFYFARIEITRDRFKNFIPIDKKEIQAFLKDKKNLKKLNIPDSNKLNAQEIASEVKKYLQRTNVERFSAFYQEEVKKLIQKLNSNDFDFFEKNKEKYGIKVKRDQYAYYTHMNELSDYAPKVQTEMLTKKQGIYRQDLADKTLLVKITKKPQESAKKIQESLTAAEGQASNALSSISTQFLEKNIEVLINKNFAN